ncbi:hypothetical protein [Bacillus sp. FSL K6-3431]|uniref:hypothetical protein n=1 Tax=Bacillus sp. FSL K6-3431 TaxID=2921500 RepID=UPI0030F81764
MDIHKHHGEVTNLKVEQLSHKELFQQLDADQLRQEKILGRLSIRSIEHEADTAECRRII